MRTLSGALSAKLDVLVEPHSSVVYVFRAIFYSYFYTTTIFNNQI